LGPGRRGRPLPRRPLTSGNAPHPPWKRSRNGRKPRRYGRSEAATRMEAVAAYRGGRAAGPRGNSADYYPSRRSRKALVFAHFRRDALTLISTSLSGPGVLPGPAAGLARSRSLFGSLIALVVGLGLLVLGRRRGVGARSVPGGGRLVPDRVRLSWCMRRSAGRRRARGRSRAVSGVRLGRRAETARTPADKRFSLFRCMGLDLTYPIQKRPPRRRQRPGARPTRSTP
jgi:hypothetical protein